MNNQNQLYGSAIEAMKNIGKLLLAIAGFSVLDVFGSYFGNADTPSWFYPLVGFELFLGFIYGWAVVPIALAGHFLSDYFGAAGTVFQEGRGFFDEDIWHKIRHVAVYCGAGILFRYFTVQNSPLLSVSNALLFIIICVLSSLISGLFGTLVILGTDKIFTAEFNHFLGNFWMGDLAGVTIFSVICFKASSAFNFGTITRETFFQKATLPETLGIGLVSLSLALIFHISSYALFANYSLNLLSLVVVLVFSLKFGSSGSIISMFSVISTLLVVSIFSPPSSQLDVLITQLTVSLCIIIALLVGNTIDRYWSSLNRLESEVSMLSRLTDRKIRFF